MKREIKFRVWEKSSKQFLKGRECKEEGDFPYNSVSYPLQGFHLEDLFNNKRFVVQQFTGLKDKTGKEIYEGDILSLGGGMRKKLHEIVFIDGTFTFENTPYDNEGIFESNLHKIIGNIYENPELLEKSN